MVEYTRYINIFQGENGDDDGNLNFISGTVDFAGTIV